MGREGVGQNCAVSQTLLFRADATIGMRFYLLRCMSLVLAAVFIFLHSVIKGHADSCCSA